jgi:deoxyribonuclease V
VNRQHPWLFPSSIEEAKQSQQQMSELVCLDDHMRAPPLSILGMDVSNNRFDPTQMIYAGLVRMSYPSMEVIETVTRAEKQSFPYITGLLGFREAPVLYNAFKALSARPDVILVDGQGICHPRGLGIASHLGILLDIPTIGVAKSVLIGKTEEELPEEAESKVPMFWKGKIIAMQLRTKKGCTPLIISPGHKMTLKSSVDLVLKCLKGYRLPEPTRQAHLKANECRITHKQEKDNHV